MQASSPRQHHLTLNTSGLNLNNSSHKIESNSDIFHKLLELGTEPDRKFFVDRLQIVWEEFNIQCRNLPNISKHPLDLYKLYSSVRDKGGFNEVTRLKYWKDISTILNITKTASAAFNIKKRYIQLGVFHYECKYDRGSIDPLPLIADMEKTSKKATNSSSSSSSSKLGKFTKMFACHLFFMYFLFKEKTPKKSKNNTNSIINTNGNGIVSNNSQITVNNHQYPIDSATNYSHTNYLNNNNNNFYPPGVSQNIIPAASSSSSSSSSSYQQQQQQQQYQNYFNTQHQQQLLMNTNNSKPMSMNYGYMVNSQQQQQQPQFPISQNTCYPQQPQIPQRQMPQQYADNNTNLYNTQQYHQQQLQQQRCIPINQQTPTTTTILPQQTPIYTQQQQTVIQNGYNTNYPSIQHTPQMQPTPTHTLQQHSSTDASQMPPYHLNNNMINNTQIQAQLQQPTLHQNQRLNENQKVKQPPLPVNNQQQQQPQVVQPPNLNNRYAKQPQIVQQSKKEPLFPVDSIEATQVNEVKKRKITSKDITPLDPWKLYLCLKSGLLSESTWALDALNIALFDDNTLPYFHLKHFPGLLKILLQYYVKCLKELFKEEFEDDVLLNSLNFDENINQIDENDEQMVANRTINSVRRDENDTDSDDDDDDECRVEDNKVFKLAFNDKEMNKFCSYYKTGSMSRNDSRSSLQLNSYCNRVVEKYSNSKRNRHKKQKIEDSSYLKTHLNSNDELIKMEKIFFGQKYFEQKHQQSANSSNERSSSSNLLMFEKEEQAIIEEECLFKILSQKEEELMQRCMCISTIIRNLTFVPGNDVEMCKNTAFIATIGQLLKFKHKHNFKNHNENQENVEKPLELNNEWWWECAYLIRENTLVTVSNIASALNLNNYNENIIKLFVDGLIHWCICKSSDTIDTLSTLSDTSTISAQRLAVESLSKMTIFDVNIDLVLATVSNFELDSFFNVLSELLIRRDEQTLREFSIVLLTSIAKCDQLSTKLITKYFSLLITFLEDFEEQARVLYSHHHHHQHHHYSSSNHENTSLNEDNLGTTVDMLLRCASCLVHLALVPDNVPTINKYQERLLDLSTSQYIDFHVSKKVAEVLYHCSNVNNNNNNVSNCRVFLPYS